MATTLSRKPHIANGTMVVHVGRDVASAVPIGFATDLSCRHNLTFIEMVTARTGERFPAGAKTFLESIRIFWLAASLRGQVS